ncbi:MAG: AgmX/PglI C-terminal domain-containing protein [Polyangiales bacterium]
MTPPPASGGGYAKYLIVLLLLVGGGLGVYFATQKDPAPPQPPPEKPKNVERSTALTEDAVEIPEEEPDAGEVDAAVEPAKKPRQPAGDPWVCVGDIPAAELQRVTKQEQAAIRACYERQLRNNNQLQGDVQLQVRVGNDGKVAATRVRGNLRDNEVKNCMQGIAKGWSFPAPAGGPCAVFEVPYHFTPKQ